MHGGEQGGSARKRALLSRVRLRGGDSFRRSNDKQKGRKGDGEQPEKTDVFPPVVSPETSEGPRLPKTRRKL